MVALVCIFIFAVKCVVGGIVLTAIGASTDSQSGSPLLLVIGPVLMCVGFVLFVIGSFRFASCKDMTTARQSGQPMDQVSRVVTSSGAPSPEGARLSCYTRSIWSVPGVLARQPGRPPIPRLLPTPTLQTPLPCREGIHRRPSPPIPRDPLPHPRDTPLLACLYI
ncbi:uncharacterized protein LOC144924686 [Branchiostoma floridae x Branchiostoma belcheri]